MDGLNRRAFLSRSGLLVGTASAFGSIGGLQAMAEATGPALSTGRAANLSAFVETISGLPGNEALDIDTGSFAEGARALYQADDRVRPVLDFALRGLDVGGAEAAFSRDDLAARRGLLKRWQLADRRDAAREFTSNDELPAVVERQIWVTQGEVEAIRRDPARRHCLEPGDEESFFKDRCGAPTGQDSLDADSPPDAETMKRRAIIGTCKSLIEFELPPSQRNAGYSLM